MRKLMMTLLVFVLTTTLMLPGMSDAASTRSPMIEVGSVSGLDGEVKVPIRLHNLSRISTGSFKIDDPTSSAFELERFELTPMFDGGQFNTTPRKDGDELYVDFISSDEGNNVNVEEATIGYIVYDISDSAGKGTQSLLSLEEVSLQDQSGRDQRFERFNGMLTKERPMGDVLGTNDVNAAQALRILQHVSGDNPLSGYDVKNSADVDGDGNIAQADAMKILRNVVGLEDSFIQIKTNKLPNVLLEQEYHAQLQADFGAEPYTWSRGRGSRLPSGIRLDSETGVLSGTSTREGEYSFSIEVTDRNGNSTTKEFKVNAIESNVESIESLDPVSVEAGETPTLPSSVEVTYKDGSIAQEDISWAPVNTSQTGTIVATGDVGDTGLTVSIEVVVHNDDEEPYIAEDQIVSVENDYLGLLNVHTIEVNVKKAVYKMNVEAQVRTDSGRTRKETIAMHYEGNNKFSLATPRLAAGQTITLIAYDEFGDKITEKEYRLK
ncbi:putative Ig domain-containing protein [Pontibacillus marinus]|uniref:Bacterial Ig-like domain-containing protein n=1 Tax=Pontibacillus marinus BH030004 = DSM 16465 TaxID=1385511 RepID=A0A0A5G255_9BACI|nr:putative Ig domain-containing protein [Pontibacillus marinus]KGX85160.1 hypothetical protein N783_11425 [Pontibacillus marinus BH030004 = DSM 16465]